MKETGIIMSGDHPLKCIDGTKTMTRRLAKLHDYNKEPDKWHIRPGVNCWFADSIERNTYNYPAQQIYIKCPYGLVGDRLWVRETFGEPFGKGFGILYRADYGDNLHTWKPSIHMFRKDSRITLEITEVRVERVQEISEEDCIAETGMSTPYCAYGNDFQLWDGQRYISNEKAQMVFKELWDSLNAKRGYGWDTNCWVWVISFKLIKE